MMRLVVVLLAVFAAGCFTWPRLHNSGLPDTEYYTDLGPGSIDVSSYTPVMQANYRTFALVCGDCHPLARAVNSTTQSRTYWRFHLARMSLHSRMRHAGPISREDREAVLDFLQYDDQIRKRERRAEFEKLDEELKKRFDPILEKQLRELYERG